MEKLESHRWKNKLLCGPLQPYFNLSYAAKILMNLLVISLHMKRKRA